MKILITGGAGYIGSLLTPALLAEGNQVTVVDDFHYQQASLLDCCHYDRFEIVRGDCRDEELMKKLVSKADVIIPLAALVGCAALRPGIPLARRQSIRRPLRCSAGSQAGASGC